MYCACYVDLYKALLLDYELELELHTLTQAAHLICALVCKSFTALTKSKTTRTCSGSIHTTLLHITKLSLYIYILCRPCSLQLELADEEQTCKSSPLLPPGTTR